MLLRLSEKQSSMTFSSTIGICQKILMDICVGNIMFICALHILSRVFLRSSAGVHKYRYKDFFFAIIISSYFKIFLVCMMIWEFPSPVIFIIDLFVLSSNVIAIKVITESAVSRCVGTCLCAHGAKFLATKLFEKWSLKMDTGTRIWGYVSQIDENYFQNWIGYFKESITLVVDVVALKGVLCRVK